MKKFIAIVAVVASLTACNSGVKTETTTVDSTSVKADTTTVVVDSTKAVDTVKAAK